MIAAAKKLFADQGLDAQMPDVAKAAKVGVGTVYRHFPTKDDLIAALAAERFERLAEKAREALEAEDPWEGLCDFIRFSAQIQADDRGLCEVMGSRPEVMERRGLRGRPATSSATSSSSALSARASCARTSSGRTSR